MRNDRIHEPGEEPLDIEAATLAFAAAVVRLVQDHGPAMPTALADKLVIEAGELGAAVAEAYVGHNKRHYREHLNKARRQSRQMAYWLRVVASAEAIPPEALSPFLENNQILHDTLTGLCATAQNDKATDKS